MSRFSLSACFRLSERPPTRPPFRAATNAAAAADAGRHPPERQRYGSADAQTWQNGVRAGENCRTAEKSGDDEREYYHRASLAAA